MTMFPLGVCAVASSSFSSALETPGSSACAWILNHVGPVFHDNFERGHREPGKFVLALFLSTTGAVSIPGVCPQRSVMS